MDSKRHKYGRAAVLIVLCTMVTKVFGAGRDLVLSYCYGSTIVSDAYILATTLPVTIFAFIYEGIAASYIPVSTRLNSLEERNQLTNNLINLLWCLTAIVVILIEIFPEQVIKIFASGFSQEALQIAVYITRLSVLGVFFSSTTYVLTYYLNYHNSFYVPAIRAIPMDLAVIISIFAGAGTKNLFPIAFGVPLSLLISLLFIFPFAINKGYRYRFTLSVSDENIKNIIVWSIPVIVSTAIADINSIIDRQFASWLITGGISVLTYSSRTLDVIRTTLFVPVITVLFPAFSRDIHMGEKEKVAAAASKAFSMLSLIAIPLTFGTMALSEEIISVLFQRGAFDRQAAFVTGNCLKFYAAALWAYAIITITTKIFHAMTDMKSPMRISVIGVVINIMGNICFSKFFGISGLSIATSVSVITIALMQYFLLNYKLKFDNKHFIKTILKSLIASFGMLMTLIALKSYFSKRLTTVFLVGICVIGSVLTYLALLALQRTDEIKQIRLLIKKDTKEID